MSTAHKPTWAPARGGTSTARESDLARLSKHYSSRDMASHTKLKYRQTGQDSQEEVKNRDFRHELEDRERHVAREKEKDKRGAALTHQSESSQPSTAKKPKLDQITSGNLDADDPVDDDEDDDTDSDEDDTAALMAELNRIKHERAAEKEKQEMEQKEQEEQIRTENILSGNPLLNQATDFKVKRRWDDDVVFKNCAKGIDDRQKQATFINDSLRSEFHKKFMDKYIK